jgi:hypothetical protein
MWGDKKPHALDRKLDWAYDQERDGGVISRTLLAQELYASTSCVWTQGVGLEWSRCSHKYQTSPAISHPKDQIREGEL